MNFETMKWKEDIQDFWWSWDEFISELQWVGGSLGSPGDVNAKVGDGKEAG